MANNATKLSVTQADLNNKRKLILTILTKDEQEGKAKTKKSLSWMTWKKRYDEYVKKNTQKIMDDSQEKIDLLMHETGVEGEDGALITDDKGNLKTNKVQAPKRIKDLRKVQDELNKELDTKEHMFEPYLWNASKDDINKLNPFVVQELAGFFLPNDAMEQFVFDEESKKVDSPSADSESSTEESSDESSN